jgi:hypothetical protein
MFSFIKQLWKKKETEKVVVSSDELDAWFDLRVEEELKNSEETVQEFYESVSEAQATLKEQQSALLAASIVEEDKIEQRIKNVVLGHRMNYSRELDLFLSNLLLPVERDVITAHYFIGDLQNRLDHFSKQTAKSFQATQHLFHKEVEATVATLGELSKAVRAFQQFLDKKNVPQFVHIKKTIGIIKQKNTEQRRFHHDIKVKETRLSSAQKQHRQKEDELVALQQSKESAAFHALQVQQKEAEEKIAATERQIAQLFSQLDRGLRKYVYNIFGAEQKLVQKYLDDSKLALQDDEHLTLYAALEKCAESNERVKHVLTLHSKKYIAALRQRYLDDMSDHELVKKRVEQNQIPSRVKELEYKLNHFTEQMKRFQRELSVLREQADDAQLQEAVKKVITGVEKALDVVLTIKLSA